jgi:hypothetical protein
LNSCRKVNSSILGSPSLFRLNGDVCSYLCRKCHGFALLRSGPSARQGTGLRWARVRWCEARARRHHASSFDGAAAILHSQRLHSALGISPPNRQSAKPLNPVSTKSQEGHFRILGVHFRILGVRGTQPFDLRKASANSRASANFASASLLASANFSSANFKASANFAFASFKASDSLSAAATSTNFASASLEASDNFASASIRASDSLSAASALSLELSTDGSTTLSDLCTREIPRALQTHV